MRNVSTAYKNMLYRNQRKYVTTLDIVLSDGTQLTVTNNNIMDGGVEIDDAIGDDGSFSALGSTIINGCEVVLYNNNEMYSDYVFINAKVTIKVNLVGADSSDEIQFGVFTVDEANYGEATVTLSLLDNMCQFDRPYKSYSIYNSNTTLRTIVYDACSKCGVLYDPSMSSFPNHDFVVPNAPKDDCTYREVIGWCATLAGCFAKMTSEGKLIFDWFNVDAFDNDTGTDGGVFDSASPYATGDTLNGGSFNPWNDTTNADGGLFTDRSGIHHITSLSTQNIGVDDVVITGIHITYEKEDDNKNESVTQSVGTDDYVIEIKDNPFVNEDNYNDVLTFLTSILIGLQFRPCNVTHPNDPTIEAGDVGYIWDNKGIQHRILITRVTFSPTALQTVVCGAESPEKNSSTRLSTATKALVKSRRQLNDEKSIREQLEEDFNRAITNGKGLYFDKDTTGGALILYGHDKPLLAESKVVLKISTAGISMTGDYRGTDADTSAANAWYGFDFNGTWLANIISTVNLFFDYAHGGTLKLGGAGNGNGIFELYDASNNKLATLNKDGWSLARLAWPTASNYINELEYTDVTLVNSSDTIQEGRMISQKFTISTGTTYPVSQVASGLTAYGNSVWSMLQMSFKNLSNGKKSNIYTVTHPQGGCFIARSHGIGNAVSGVKDYWTQPLFMGIHTFCEASDSSYDATKQRFLTMAVLNNCLEIALMPPGGQMFSNNLDGGNYSQVSHIQFGPSGFGRSNTPKLDIHYNQNSAELHFEVLPTYASINDNKLAFQSSSSKRYKHNINHALTGDRDPHKLLELRVVEFVFNDDHVLQYADMADKTLPGFIAEEVDEIYPSATIHDPDTGQIENWDERRLIPGMLALIQEQDKEIKDLKSRLEKLERVIMNLQSDGK